MKNFVKSQFEIQYFFRQMSALQQLLQEHLKFVKPTFKIQLLTIVLMTTKMKK